MTEPQNQSQKSAPTPPKATSASEEQPETPKKAPKTTPPPPANQKTAPNKKYTQSQESAQMAKKSSKPITTIIIALVVVLAGIGTGYVLSKVVSFDGGGGSSQPVAVAPDEPDQITAGETYGSKTNGFSDEATGVLIEGGTDGEGTHRLLRPGGESQIICITSSVLDMDLFVGHQIVIWGETFDTQKCGWFMDVGRVEVQELNAEKPFELEEEMEDEELEEEEELMVE